MKKKSRLKIKVGLSGASGRMGEAVKKLINAPRSGFLLTEKMPPFKVEILSAQQIRAGFETWDAKQITGVIDFSSPKLFKGALNWCVKNKKPFVSGTTALKTLEKEMKRASKKIPIFYEENMSLGIWQITKWIEGVTHLSESILLEDIHHKDKKDKPSGTALKLKRHFPAFAKEKLKIKSLRRGKEFGIHRIIWKGPEEEVLLEHKALSRRLFASGALKALKWLINRPSGLYSFEDIYKN